MKVSVYIATSLDGFPDGSLDWLPGTGEPGSEDYGYGAFFASVDALVMGRETFEKVLSFGPWPYGGKRAYPDGLVQSRYEVLAPEVG